MTQCGLKCPKKLRTASKSMGHFSTGPKCQVQIVPRHLGPGRERNVRTLWTHIFASKMSWARSVR